MARTLSSAEVAALRLSDPLIEDLTAVLNGHALPTVIIVMALGELLARTLAEMVRRDPARLPHALDVVEGALRVTQDAMRDAAMSGVDGSRPS